MINQSTRQECQFERKHQQQSPKLFNMTLITYPRKEKNILRCYARFIYIHSSINEKKVPIVCLLCEKLGQQKIGDHWWWVWWWVTKGLGDGTAELSLVVIATETETVAGNTAEFWQKPRKTFPGYRPYPVLLLVKATESNSCCNIDAIDWLRILFSSDKSCLSAHPLHSEEEQVSLKGSQQ